MAKIIIEVEELPSLSEAKDFFKEVLIAYLTDCKSGVFDYGFQKVKWEIQ